MVQINLNDTVKFKLTDLGKDIYYHQYDDLIEYLKKKGITPSFKQQIPKVDENGYTTMQLWCFIELYGNYIGAGKPNVIEPLNLYFKSAEE